tara:strand:+ start:9838 stop:13143 length:3306 start_codon:yes stop_codon:yes gene_type:complete
MSKKNFFFTNTSIFPARLVETTGSRNSNSLPPIAALDPLMAGSSFQPDPAFAPSEQEVQSQIDAINTRFDNQLNEVSDFIAEEYRAIDAGERTRQDGTADRTQLIRYINDRSTLQASQQEEILNAPADLVSNDFEWLRNKRFNLRTRNIDNLGGSVDVIFGPVNRDGDLSSYDSQEENNLYYRRARLGGSEGYTKQSVVVQGLLPEYATRRDAEDDGNGRPRANEFRIYQARARRQILSFKKFVDLFNRTVVSGRIEKLRLGLISNIEDQADNQYMNSYSCLLMPLAIQTDWVKDSKVTHDYLNRLGGIAAVTTIDAEYNYPAPAKYYDLSPDQFTRTGADGDYSALLNQPEIEGNTARIRTEDSYDSIPESRKRQLPRYVQVTFNRRSFGSLSRKIEEANGFSTFVPRMVESMESGRSREYFLKSNFQFLNGEGQVITADETIPVQVVDLESELDSYIASLTSQEDPQPLPPNYFGAEAVLRDEAGNEAPPQQDACVSFLDRIKMASLQSEIKALRDDYTNDLTYENVWTYIHSLNRQIRLKASRQRIERDVEAGRRTPLVLENLAESIKTADPTTVSLNAKKPEVLFYRIDQHEVDDNNNVNLEPTSKYYVRGGKTKYTYVDPRVEFGAKYKYVIYAYVIAPALQYEIGKVEPVTEGGGLKVFRNTNREQQRIQTSNVAGAFTTAQNPYAEGNDWVGDDDTFKQVYDEAKRNRADFNTSNSNASQLVRDGAANLTELNTAMNIYSRNRLLLAKVPVSSVVYESGGKLGVSLPATIVLDRPPVPPHVDIVPFRNNSRQILINFNGQTDKIFPSKDIDVNDQDNSIPYIPIEPGDADIFARIRDAQLLENFDLPEGHLEFASEGEDLERFEVYRTTSEPDPRSPYAAFSGNKVKDVVRVFGQAYTDNIQPNTNYYYTFRAVDNQGNFSNPTEIYKVYISEDKGQVVPVIKAFKPVRPKNQKDLKSMRKFIMIDPYVLQTSAAATEAAIGQLPEKTLGSKFKVRITSKDTGRKVDLNLNFKPPTMIRTDEVLNDLVRLRYGLLDTTPALIENRLEQIRNQLQSANVDLTDFDLQLENRLKQVFGEGNYEPYLAQFQGRSQEE